MCLSSDFSEKGCHWQSTGHELFKRSYLRLETTLRDTPLAKGPSMPSKKKKSHEAIHGEKMIEVKIRFWTNRIASREGEIIPKNAWASGMVRMERNDSHGIKPGKPLPFHSLLDVGATIQKVLIKHGVVLHAGRTMEKYFSSK